MEVAFSAAIAAAFAVWKAYSLALFTAIFLGLFLGSLTFILYGPRRGYERIRKSQLRAFEEFKQRLATEGVIDETGDIAKAKRMPWVSDEDIHQQLLWVKDFAEIVNFKGRTYLIHRETLNNIA